MGFSKSKFKIFISSHTESLIREREEVEQILRNIGFKNIFRAEKTGSKNASPSKVCLDAVKDCNLFILLLGEYYSSKPLDEKSLSPTEKEYNQAKKIVKDRLVFKIECANYQPRQIDFIRKVENFEKGRSRGPTIKELEDLKQRIEDDVKAYVIEKKVADRKIESRELLTSEMAVKFGTRSKPVPVENSQRVKDSSLLLIKARIEYDREAGNGQIVKFLLNDYEFTEEDLVNKPLKFIQADSRSFSWYDQATRCWSLPYSRNFKDNYSDSRYKITNGDAYTYIFSLQNVKNLKRSGNVVKVVHSGSATSEAHKNRIVIGKCEFIQ